MDCKCGIQFHQLPRCLIFTFIHSIFTQCHSSRYQNEVTRSLPTYHTYLIWYSVQFDPLFHQLIPAGVVILTDQQLDESPSARYCLFCLSPFQKQHDSHQEHEALPHIYFNEFPYPPSDPSTVANDSSIHQIFILQRPAEAMCCPMQIATSVQCIGK